MKKTTKTWLIAACCLVLVGCILFVCVMSALKWDFSKLSTVEYKTNTYEIGQSFSDISITTDTSDIALALSDDGKCRVECYEEEKEKHSVTVENGALVIKIDNQKSWYDYIGFNFDSPKVTVYLSKAEYGALTVKENSGNITVASDCVFGSVDITSTTGNVNFGATATKSVKIKTTTGNIRVENASAEAFDLSVGSGIVDVHGVTCQGAITVEAVSGDVRLTDLVCKSLSSNGSRGDITLSNVIIAETLFVERGSGNVKFVKCDAAELTVKTKSGNVIGSLLSSKVFVATSDKGNVRVPKTTSGGKCQITSDRGDIEIEIAE